MSFNLSGMTGKHRSAARQLARQTHRGVAISSSKSPYKKNTPRNEGLNQILLFIILFLTKNIDDGDINSMNILFHRVILSPCLFKKLAVNVKG